jgi:hypothetical protein
MAEEETPKAPKTSADAKSSGSTEKNPKPAAKGDKSAGAAKGKKEKPPAVEDKPFTEFIQQHYLPDLEKALAEEGLTDVDLSFEKAPLQLVGMPSDEAYWQVIGRWQSGRRQFNVAFLKEDIKEQKLFACADGGATPSAVEQFMGDERRINLDLMVLYTVQRLNGQKWLTRN